MKFLAFSDIHCANHKAFSRIIDGRNSRLLSIIDCIGEIQRIGKSERVDFYIFGGDVFHTQGFVETDVFNLTFDSFKQFDKPVYCVAGNHDNFKSLHLTDIAFLKFGELPNIKIISNEQVDGILGFGYRSDLTTGEIVQCLQKEKPKILLIHQTPQGCRVNDYTFEEGIDYKILEQYVDLILFGHVHQPQKLTDKTYVIGAPLHHNFGDVGNRGVWIFEDTVSRFIPLKFPQFITVEQVTEAVVEDKLNYYRVLSSTDTELGLPNVVVSKMIPSLEFADRKIINTSMTTEGVIDKYLDYKEVRNGKYRTYGLDKLKRAEAQCINITPSNYRAVTLTIEGFLSFKSKAELQFKDGVWLVLGVGEGFASNGAGKSSLFDAIFWCLYGKTAKDLSGDDVINDELGKDCKVTMTLVDDTTKSTLFVERFRKYKKQGTGLRFTVNDIEVEGTPTILEKKLVGLLGFDYDFFLNTVYYSQEKTEFFASSTDGARKSFLDSVLQTEKYAIALKAVREDISRYEDIRKELEHKVTYISEALAKRKKELEDLATRQDLFEKDREFQVNLISKRIEDAQQELRKAEESEKAIASQKVTIDDDTELVALEKELKELNDRVLEQTDRLSQIKIDLTKKLGNLTGELRSLQREVDKNEEKFFRVQDLKDDVICEYCGNKITYESRTAYMQKLADEIEIIKANISSKQKKVVVLTEELEMVEKDNHKVVQDGQEQKAQLTAKVSTLRNKSREAREKFEVSLQEARTQVRRASEKLVSLQKDLERVRNEVNPYLMGVDDKNNEISDRTLELRQTEALLEQGKEEIDMAKFWETAFSNTGIKSLLLDEFCALFNAEVNKSVSILSNGTISMGLSPVSTLKSGDVRDKLSFMISLLGKEKSYGNLSGGEKRRVDIATMITLNKIIRTMYNIKSGLLGLLILDEIFSYLDDTGEEDVFFLLTETAKEIKCIYVITHTDELKSFFENTIVVKKKDRSSFLAKK